MYVLVPTRIVTRYSVSVSVSSTLNDTSSVVFVGRVISRIFSISDTLVDLFISSVMKLSKLLVDWVICFLQTSPLAKL